MTRVLAGIDIGTSGVKTVLVDSDGKLLAWAGKEYTIDTPRADWAEQDPHAWLEAAVSTLTTCLKEIGCGDAVRSSPVEAIGLTGQMHSLVCLDESGKPLRPAMIWADRRSRAQVQRLTRQIGIENLGTWTGNPLATGFMLASWTWLCENEPEISAATRWLLLPKDEVRFRLTGKIGSEPSDASSTLLFDPHHREWSRPLLDMIGLSPSRLPEIHESSAIAGGLLPAIASACGLPSGIPVVYGCSDQAAQALSQGVLLPGTLSCTIGTGGQLFAPLEQPIHDPLLRLHLFCHALTGIWHHESATLSAGLALRWLRDQLWPSSNFSELADSAALVVAASEGLFFLPYLAGERTPHMDSSVRAAFIGMDIHHNRPHLVRAAMEGVVFALRQGLDLMLALGTPIERLVAAGGGTRHPLWLQLQADIFNRMVYPSQTVEATARGAALLAGIGANVYSDARQALQHTLPPPLPPILPRPESAERYAAAYTRFCQLYPALKQAEDGGSSG